MFSGEGTLPCPHSHNWKYHTTLPKPPKGQDSGQDTSVKVPFHLCIVNGSHFGKWLPNFLGNEASIPAVRRRWRQKGGLPDQLKLHSKTLSQNKNKNMQTTKYQVVVDSVRKPPPRRDRAGAHTDSQRQQQRSQDPHRFRTDGSQLRQGGGHGLSL